MKSIWPWIAILVLFVLHQDFWNWDRYKPLVFGFIPIGLAYHAAYSVAASVLMWMLVRHTWPKHLESDNPTPASHQKSEDAS